MPFNPSLAPLGQALPAWTPKAFPKAPALMGRHCKLEPLEPKRHAQGLFEAFALDATGQNWTYMPAGPFAEVASLEAHLEALASTPSLLHLVVVDPRSQAPVGSLALMRIDPAHGVAEVGHVAFSPLLQGSVASTEAQFLLMRHVFEDLGYRRYEWKCNALNAPSRRAATRLGFRFEGLFRQAMVVKGRNRDTAWFAMLDGEWPALKAAFEAWLAPENFDAEGRQRQGLAQLRAQQAQAAFAQAAGPRSSAGISVRPLGPEDHAAWLPLWQAYQAFYEVALGPEVDAGTWARLSDPASGMFALGAFGADGALLGIVHGVFHRSTWALNDDCYLQDLFTLPEARGRGVGRALIEAVYAKAREAGSKRVHWLTHERNLAGQALYDQVADKPGFIEYEKHLN